MRFPVQSAEVAWRGLEDQVVILDLSKGRLFHEVNETGTVIWKLADGTRTPERIAQELISFFDVSEDTALADVQEFLSLLKEKGLIDWADHPVSGAV